MKVIIAVPQTTLKLFEVEVQEGSSKEQTLKAFQANAYPTVSDASFIGTCKVGEYMDRATILSEVPEKT